MPQIALGIDIGGTTTKLAIISREGLLLERISLNTWQFNETDHFFNALYDAIAYLFGQFRSSQVSGIGIGAPSCSPYKGTIHGAANLPFKEEVQIVKKLKNRFALPTFLMKDGNTAALGESLFGGARGMKSFIVLTLGTGLGCGMIIDNKVVEGKNGLVSEWGHSPLPNNDRACGCGNTGCLETYISATGIKRTLFQLISTSVKPSKFRDLPFNKIYAKDIYDAATNGDILAQQAFKITAKVLGKKLAELVTLIGPEAIFLSGGLAASGALLFKPTKMEMEKQLLPMYKNSTPILPSTLNTNEAALLGAASLVWQNNKINIPCQ